MKKQLLLAFTLLASLSAYSTTLNFDQPNGTTSWSEDGYTWSFGAGADNCGTNYPHTGSGNGTGLSGNCSKLSAAGQLLDITSVWVQAFNVPNIDYFRIRGYNAGGVQIDSIDLDPSFFDNVYAQIMLNWTGIKSIKFDYRPVDPGGIHSLIVYDDMEYIAHPVGIASYTESGLAIFPNPFSGQLHVEGLNKQVTFSILDITGRVVMTGKLNAETAMLNTSGLQQGLYLLCVGDDKKQTYRIVKSRE